MKDKRSFIFIAFLLTLFSFSIKGQNSTFVGVEASVTSDLYEIHDPSKIISTTPLITGSWGITIGRKITDNFLIESGIIRKYYDDGYAYSSGSLEVGVSSNSFNTWQIPLRLKSNMNLINQRLFLNTTIGYHFCINSDYGKGGGSGFSNSIIGNDTVSVKYTINDSIAQTFSLLEIGIGLEYNFTKDLLVYISSSYFIGLDRVQQLDFTTSGFGNYSDEAIAVSKGSYWNIAFGIKYSISRLFRKEKNGM